MHTRYSAVAIAFHWAIAAFLLTNLGLGVWMGYAEGMAKFSAFQLHKSIGLTVLILSLGRLGWRLLNPPPPEPATLKPWERAASLAVHWAFYAVMILMPLSGWVIVSTSKIDLPTLVFKVLPWPHLPLHDFPAAPKAAWNGAGETTHLALAWGTAGLLLLHLGAVAKHHLFDRMPVLARMWPFTPRAA